VWTGPQSVAETTITAVTGNRVTLSCRTTLATPVDWYYLPSQNASGRILYSAGNIVNGHDKRFALDRSIQGEFSLIIVNVTREDEGLYICKEDAGLGMAHRVQLYVHGRISIFSCIRICSLSRINTWNIHKYPHKARYTLATKLNSTRSTLCKVDNVDRVALAPYTLATKSTVSATVDFVADLLPVSATVDFVASVYWT